jgi:transcriptional regulator with XRE-family HTH domain
MQVVYSNLVADNSRTTSDAEGPVAAEALLAERLRALREAADLTQGQLAERMTQLGFPMHQTAIAKIERGQRPVRLNEVAAFAAALRVPVTDLLADAEGTPESEALWPELLTMAAQRSELTRRHDAIQAERKVLAMQQAELYSRLEAINQREAEARKKWQEAKARQHPDAFTPKEHPPVTIATAKELYANALTCAYPGCGRPLYRVNEDGTRTLNSRISHICARQEGGPRWDPEMSSEENRSVNNLLLLCIEHADEIDQPQRSSLYSVSVLHNWKREQLARVDEHASGYKIINSEAREVIRESASLELQLTAEVINLGGEGGNAPSSGGGGGAAIGKGAKGGKGGSGGPITINLRGESGRAPGAGGGGAGFIDPDSPLFWKGQGMPTFGESSFLGLDGADGGDTTISSMDDGRVLLRAKGGQGAKAGTGIRSSSDKLAVSTLMLANYIEFQGSFGYVTGTGFSYYNVLNLKDPLALNGLLTLECGGAPPGEYGLTFEAVDPEDNVMSTITFVFQIIKAGDILRMMFKFSLSVVVNQFGMWTIVARHEERELARLPIVIKQGVSGT